MIKPITTIWQDSSDGPVFVTELIGLPLPVPELGDTVFIHGIGETVCTGFGNSGSNNDLVEVILTVK